MNQLIRRQRRILCGTVLLFLATLLCSLPMGFADEPAAPPPTKQEPPALAPEGSDPPPEAGEVQERAVPRRALPGQGLSVSGCYCKGGTGSCSGITRPEGQSCYKRSDDTCSGVCDLTSAQPSTGGMFIQ